MSDQARDTFVARFGEEQAGVIEAAAYSHQVGDQGGTHDDDDHGTQPFRYWFLLAIGFECVTRPEFRAYHGVTADVEMMKQWALDPNAGDLAGHDGDVPDFMAMIAGMYDFWVGDPDEARLKPGEFDAQGLPRDD